MKFIAAILVFAALFFPMRSTAQTFQGSLRGRIVDPNGAGTPESKTHSHR